MFRLCDAEMYTGMKKFGGNMVVDRGIALHKMIRLITASLAGEGYLNFMGNEFGHPEWIDFPREGNGWSYHYCRRQWSLVDDETLRYVELNDFDKAMLSVLQKDSILETMPTLRWIHEDDKVIIYTKGDYVFAFNFHPYKSFEGYFIPVGTEAAGTYQMVLSTDDGKFGGFNRTDNGVLYDTYMTETKQSGFNTYLPSRSAVVFQKINFIK